MTQTDGSFPCISAVHCAQPRGAAPSLTAAVQRRLGLAASVGLLHACPVHERWQHLEDAVRDNSEEGHLTRVSRSGQRPSSNDATRASPSSASANLCEPSRVSRACHTHQPGRPPYAACAASDKVRVKRASVVSSVRASRPEQLPHRAGHTHAVGQIDLERTARLNSLRVRLCRSAHRWRRRCPRPRRGGYSNRLYCYSTTYQRRTETRPKGEANHCHRVSIKVSPTAPSHIGPRTRLLSRLFGYLASFFINPCPA